MSLDITCPLCDEAENLEGRRSGDRITITCGECGQVWDRPTDPVCARCAGTDLQAVPHAIVEKSRGTQLSVVGIRIVHLCWICDADAIERWQRNRPNPLLPKELPTVTSDEEGARGGGRLTGEVISTAGRDSAPGRGRGREPITVLVDQDS